MKYKDIIKKINKYEEEYRKAFYIYCDHDVSKTKTKLLKDTHNLYTASIAALFDFITFSKFDNGNELSNEQISFLEEKTKNQTIELYNKIKETKSKSTASKYNNEVKRLIDYLNVYKEIYNELSLVPKNQISKIIKFANKKKENLIKNEENDIKTKEEYFIAETVSKINELYKRYNEVTHNLVDRLYRGGTHVEEYEKERKELSYNYILLIDAIENAIGFKSQGKKITEEELLVLYNSIILEYEKQYSDEDFETYKKTCETTYILTNSSLNKMQKKLKGKIRKRK